VKTIPAARPRILSVLDRFASHRESHHFVAVLSEQPNGASRVDGTLMKIRPGNHTERISAPFT